jgi:translation initiation factor IF-1
MYDIRTKDIMNELIGRKGVKRIRLGKGDKVKISDVYIEDNDWNTVVEGRATIIIITDE